MNSVFFFLQMRTDWGRGWICVDKSKNQWTDEVIDLTKQQNQFEG